MNTAKLLKDLEAKVILQDRELKQLREMICSCGKASVVTEPSHRLFVANSCGDRCSSNKLVSKDVRTINFDSKYLVVKQLECDKTGVYVTISDELKELLDKVNG